MDNWWPAVGAFSTVVVLAVGLLGLYIRYLILQHTQTCPWPEKVTRRLIDLEQKVDRHLERNQARGGG